MYRLAVTARLTWNTLRFLFTGDDLEYREAWEHGADFGYAKGWAERAARFPQREAQRELH